MNRQYRGFTLPLILIVVAILLIGSGSYVYTQSQQPEKQWVDHSDQKATSTVQSIIQITSPQSGETIIAGQTHTIKWNTKGLSNAIGIELFSANKLSRNDPAAFLVGETPNTGRYVWHVDPKTPSGSYYVLVMDNNSDGPGEPSVIGKSDVFTISGAAAAKPPVITSVSPDTAYVDNSKYGEGGTIIVNGSGFTNNYGASYRVQIISASGTYITDVPANTTSGNPTSDTQFAFTVPNSIAAGKYQVLIENSDYGLKSNAHAFSVVYSEKLLPRDPGVSGTKTLLGIDSDNDGVRDDIQRFIAATSSPRSAKGRAALNQFAVALQAAILAGSTGSGATAAASKLDDAQDCVWYLKMPDAIWKEVIVQFVNTNERYTAYSNYNAARNGSVGSLTHDSQLRDGCTFNPEALPN